MKKNIGLLSILAFVGACLAFAIPNITYAYGDVKAACKSEGGTYDDSYGFETCTIPTNETYKKNEKTVINSVTINRGSVYDNTYLVGDVVTTYTYSYTQMRVYKVLTNRQYNNGGNPVAESQEEREEGSKNETKTVTGNAPPYVTVALSFTPISNGIKHNCANVVGGYGGSKIFCKDTYYVKQVTITPSDSGHHLEGEGAPTATCSKTYGDNSTKPCPPAHTTSNKGQYIEHKWTHTDPITGKKDTKTAKQWNFKDITLTNPVSEIVVDAVRGLQPADSAVTCKRNYYNGDTRDCTGLMNVQKNSNGWGTGGGKRRATWSYTYTGPLSGRTDTEKTYRDYFYVTSIKVTGTSKSYVTTNAKYAGSGELSLTEESYSASCTKTFGNGTTRSCVDGDITKSGGQSGSSGGDYPANATLTHTPNKNGWSPGGGVRNNYYQFTENGHNGSWTIKMYYVTKVALSGGTSESAKVKVLETHNRNSSLGTPTKTSDPQVTTGYTAPSCLKTYGDGSSRSCTGQMDTNLNYNNWGMGSPYRKVRYIYRENTHQDDWFITLMYIMKINVVVGSPKTYQDQPYGTYSCTKTFADGSSMSCMDKLFINQDSGQNSSMGGSRKIDYRYVNNGYQSTKTQTRVYSSKVTITAPATQGKTGFKGKYYSKNTWQDGTTKDISLIKDTWKSTVCSTGEEVKYLNDVWSYTDAKGDVHGNSSINEFYITDPVAKQYCISSTYPVFGPIYNNGLPPASYAGDSKVPQQDKKTFNLIGIENIIYQDKTVYVHDIDKNSSGNRLTNTYPVTTASSFSGLRTAPNFGLSPVLAFNNKTYQTGHWYDFRIKVLWSNGTTQYLQDTSSFPEATWRYRDAKGNYRYDYTDYPVGGTNGFFPYNSSDHRILLEGWNVLRFDMFSEGVRKPSSQNTGIYQKTYTMVNLWAHSPNSITIAGPSVVENPEETQSYLAYINWKDGKGIKQDGTIVGADNNPWGGNHGKRTDGTTLRDTIWHKEQEQLTTPSNGSVRVSFPEFKGNVFHRTISVSWGDTHRVLPGFKYWDYFSGQLDVLFNSSNNNPPGCEGISVPKMGCPLPIENNYRMPSNDLKMPNREVELGIRFNVTGISQGSGE
ncbi:hypothetical protein [Priestia aryabhattai]|uniref:hypothetical protein n=1 Tax=Priestia aryabhattai TaxID=412384 RepID=UPI002E223531|nr:hypothetical protein [Priestia aryabhattai]